VSRGGIVDSFQRGLFGKKNANSGKSFKSPPPAKTKKHCEKKMINTSMSLVPEGEKLGTLLRRLVKWKNLWLETV